MNNQKERVLNFIRTHGSIDRKTAINNLYIFNLPNVVRELNKELMLRKSDYYVFCEKRYNGGKAGRYVLRKWSEDNG